MAAVLQTFRFSARSLRCRPNVHRHAAKPMGHQREFSSTMLQMRGGYGRNSERDDENDIFAVDEDDGDYDFSEEQKPEDPAVAHLVNKANRDRETRSDRQFLERRMNRWGKNKMEKPIEVGDDSLETGYDPELDRAEQIEEELADTVKSKPPATFLNLGEEEPAEDEGDEEYVDTDDAYDNLGPFAHKNLEQHREMRHYARLAAWDLPLLSKICKPFEPPTADMALRFRYTTYMGEHHPAEKKVVLEFCTADMPNLTSIQRQKLMKLAGVRYNPETDIIKMSSEMYESQAQNKRYLGDRVDELLKEARDPTDTFEDVPLDTRHHKFKRNLKMPRHWKMTTTRKKELAAYREDSMKADQQRMMGGILIDGVAQIEEAFSEKKALPPAAVAEMVTVGKGKRIVGVRR